MAAKQYKGKTYNVPAHILTNIVKSQNFISATALTVTSFDDYMMTYRFKHGISLSSWGETVTIQITRMAENVTNMNVISECALPTQLVDWGKNTENINKIYNYMDRAVPVAMSAPAAQNAVPPQGYNQRPPMMNHQTNEVKRCVNCGAQLMNGAVFCTACGSKVGQ